MNRDSYWNQIFLSAAEKRRKMMSINLEYLQQHKPDAKILYDMQRTYELWYHNLIVWRRRTDVEGPKAFAFRLTHHGNKAKNKTKD